MIAYHVTSIKKLRKYLEAGQIKAPVRAWKDISGAERFSKQTGRGIILRLKLPDDTPPLEGHQGQAVIAWEPYPIHKVFNGQIMGNTR